MPLDAMLGGKKMGKTATGFEWNMPSLMPSVNVERGAWMLVGQGLTGPL